MQMSKEENEQLSCQAGENYAKNKGPGIPLKTMVLQSLRVGKNICPYSIKLPKIVTFFLKKTGSQYFRLALIEKLEREIEDFEG